VPEPKPVTAEDVERLQGWLKQWGDPETAFGTLFRMVCSTLEMHTRYIISETLPDNCLACDHDWPCPTIVSMVRCLDGEVK
jgi:hypothetical protein